MKENESHSGKQHNPLVNMILERYEKVRGELHNIEFMLLSNDDETIFTAMRRFGPLLIVYRDLVNAYEKDISIFSNENRKLLEEEKEITETMFAEIASHFLKREKVPSKEDDKKINAESAARKLIKNYQKFIDKLSTENYMTVDINDKEAIHNMIELGPIMNLYKTLNTLFVSTKDCYSIDDFSKIFELDTNLRTMLIDILKYYLDIDLNEYMRNDEKTI